MLKAMSVAGMQYIKRQSISGSVHPFLLIQGDHWIYWQISCEKAISLLFKR